MVEIQLESSCDDCSHYALTFEILVSEENAPNKGIANNNHVLDRQITCMIKHKSGSYTIKFDNGEKVEHTKLNPVPFCSVGCILPKRNCFKFKPTWPGVVEMVKETSVDKDRELEEHLPLLKCECGAKILLLPDLKVMNHAIEVHVANHRKKEKDRTKAAMVASHIRQSLIEQLFEKAGEMDK